MSHVHFVGGEKGGVGKSVVSRLLAQYFIDNGTPFAAIDADASHPALVRHYGEYTQQVDLASFESVDQIMDRALGSERRVLVDLPAQSMRPLHAWMEQGDVVSFARESAVRMSFWHVTDGGFDSVQELARLLDTFRDTLDLVVVRNHGRAKDFGQLEESEVVGRLTAQGGVLIDLPELHSATMYRIDRHGSSFWAAVNDTDSELQLPVMDRQRARLWLQKTYRAFGRLESRI